MEPIASPVPFVVAIGSVSPTKSTPLSAEVPIPPEETSSQKLEVPSFVYW